MGHELDVQRLIDAPVDTVFRSRIDLDTEREISRMYNPTADISGEVRVGANRIIAWGTEDKRCRVTQTFLEIGVNRVVYSELLEVPPSPVYVSTITETMQPQGERTLFQFHVEGFPTAEERDMHSEGYNIVLDRLQGYLASVRGS
jgi:uncharacterized protein YndB with AHSA1/START domain|tara:strand:+ start:1365 stop:1799 length:435 start_codon:yes stop_codon:yes gene_type:complete